MKLALAILWPIGWILVVFGVVVLVIGVLLAVPVEKPPTLESIHEGATAIDLGDLPALRRFSARDGTVLAYRFYAATDDSTDQLAILVHGSAGSSVAMHAVGETLARNGIAAAAIDVRGHGASGTRGDIGYLGQLDDDLADLVAVLRRRYPDARLTLVGHSSGGGFGLRIAAGPLGHRFDQFVLLSPYLGYSAPTNWSGKDKAQWANPDVPRLIALSWLQRMGIDWAQSMPVIAFATAPDATRYVTSQYSYRLLANFGPPHDWRAAFAAAQVPIDVIVGQSDELMRADAYRSALQPVASKVHVTLLSGVDHMGIVRKSSALAAVVAAVEQQRRRLNHE